VAGGQVHFAAVAAQMSMRWTYVSRVKPASRRYFPATASDDTHPLKGEGTP
jgi:hypothetical protein